MNPEPSQIASSVPTIPLAQDTAKNIHPLKSLLQKYLINTIVVSTCINVGLLGAATWSVWKTSQQLETTVARQDKQQELNNNVVYLDEVLTMSALMYTNTGQQTWERRYNQSVPTFDKIFAELTNNVAKSPKLEAASKKLFEIEDTAFKLVKQGKLAAASLLLTSAEYQQNKQVYTNELNTIATKIRTTTENKITADRQALSNAIVLELLSLGLLVLTGSLVILTVRSYIRDREKSQQSIQASQSGLVDLSEQLQQEAQLRSVQQERVVRESETLQNDIAHILDVVNLLEDGNLTIQADVNERSTGLIGDTLNRTIESLHQIISVVVSSADRVVTNAVGLEELAVSTANQAQNQTRSIQQIEMSIAQINSLSENSYQQALATTDAVELAQAALSAGQQEMSGMADGIASLQQGTEQIVKRVQTLNEFVELAAQFSKDRKRVAALTRVLALNASLLSTRALAERDPAQFASLAHEFKTIADRVNELSEDNNTSLAALQHRTNQIQTVTSGLDRDIADIDRLVQKFTDEMGKSRQAFTNIQLVTDRVAIVGERVSSSSQDIIQVVGDTLTAIQAIGVIAQNTEHKAIATQEQIQVTQHLARNLLDRVEFFQLHDATPSELPNFLPPADSIVKNPEAVYKLLLPS